MKVTFERVSRYGARGYEGERVSRNIFLLPWLLAPDSREVSEGGVVNLFAISFLKASRASHMPQKKPKVLAYGSRSFVTHTLSSRSPLHNHGRAHRTAVAAGGTRGLSLRGVLRISIAHFSVFFSIL